MSLLCAIFGHRSFNGARYNAGADYGKVSSRGTDGIGREHMVLEVKCPRCGEDNYAGRFHKHQINTEGNMTEMVDPTKTQHVFMSVSPNNTQYPYKIIGDKGKGFVAESTFKAVVHELSNTKVELNKCRKELDELKKARGPNLREDLRIELDAKEIYNKWSGHKGWTPWVYFGNSVMQDKARDLARASWKVEQEGYPIDA